MDPTLQAALDRLQRLEDRAEIVELTHRYAIAVDDRDFEAMGQLYATDAAFDSPSGRTEGRDAVVDWYRSRLPDFGATIHTPHGHVITWSDDPDRAAGVVSSHAELAIDGRAFWTAFRYHDSYVREDGTWRFGERTVRSVYAMWLDDLPNGLGAEVRMRWPGREPASADLPETLQTYLDSLPG